MTLLCVQTEVELWLNEIGANTPAAGYAVLAEQLTVRTAWHADTGCSILLRQAPAAGQQPPSCCAKSCRAVPGRPGAWLQQHSGESGSLQLGAVHSCKPMHILGCSRCICASALCSPGMHANA